MDETRVNVLAILFPISQAMTENGYSDDKSDKTQSASIEAKNNIGA